jgi:integrase
VTRPRKATTKEEISQQETAPAMAGTTARAPEAGWSYIAGEKGRNRVRVFQRGRSIWLDYQLEDGRRVKHSLGHGDRGKAKEAADVMAAKFAKEAARPLGVTTLKSLFELYEKEVTPRKAASTQAHDRRAFGLFLKAFGSNRRPETLNVRDWESFIERRRRGELAISGREGKSVRARIIQQDLKLLQAVLNWAERARDGGTILLDRNPLRKLRTPTEESPRRPVLSAEQFATVREQAVLISNTAELFVCLLWFTGHRAASVRQLRWDDVDLANGSIRWRAEVDKIGYEHRNPLHAELVPLLSDAKAIAGLTGDIWLFPCPRDAQQAMTRDDAAALWRSIADASGIKEGSGIGTHAFRRAFANRLRDVNLRDLKDLGGWKSSQTVVSVYIQPDQDAQRVALERLSANRNG